MSVWFHSTGLASSIIPLLASYPSSAVWPSAVDDVILMSVAATSFFAQMVLSRGFQLQSAAKASAINLTQVSLSECLAILNQCNLKPCLALGTGQCHTSLLFGHISLHIFTLPGCLVIFLWVAPPSCCILLARGLGISPYCSRGHHGQSEKNQEDVASSIDRRRG